MFCIPWFLTLFSTKIDTVETVLEFWTRLSEPDVDETIIFFISIALVIKNKELILKTDESNLPEVMTTLTIKNQEDMNELFQLAYELLEKTPASFSFIHEIRSLFIR